MRARALDVERAPLGARERPGGADVDAGAGEADDQHDAPSTSGGSASRWTASHAITPASTSSVAPLTWAERISARPSPNVKRAAGRPGREPRRDQRERDRAGVGEHVRGVGEQRERVGQQARDDLDDHEARISPSATPASGGRRRAPARASARGRGRARVRGRPPPRPYSWSSLPFFGLSQSLDLLGRVRRPAPARLVVAAELVEDLAEALLVELERLAGLLARVGLLVARRVLAGDDPVVLARLDPRDDLLDAPHRVAVREEELAAQAVELVPARAPVLVLARLADERVEVELARRGRRRRAPSACGT